MMAIKSFNLCLLPQLSSLMILATSLFKSLSSVYKVLTEHDGFLYSIACEENRRNSSFFIMTPHVSVVCLKHWEENI